jgi:3-hydroxy-9,10-secoandrosta-1,3,5(10)-triene-9,17-dione monooxygenase
MTHLETTDADAAVETPEQLIEWARSMIPVVRERGPQGSKDRQLPQETVEDFKRAGLIRAFQPQRFGGQEWDLEILFDAAMLIARGDGASGWLSSFWPLHQFQVGWFSEQAQEEYWSTGPDTLSSTVPAMRSQREVVRGGLRVTGRTSFSSGVDYAEWLLYHTVEETCLIPREDVELFDDWETTGLRGTGSKGVICDDVFIPEHRVIKTSDMLQATYPGAQLSDNPWYHVSNPVMMILNHGILAPVIGMGRGVLETFDERVRSRMDSQALKPATTRSGPQMRYAEASCELDAAEMMLRANLSFIRESGGKHHVLTIEERATMRRNIVYAAMLVRRATNRLVDGMDSSGLYETNHLNRQAMDVRAGGLQIVLAPEETMMDYSRVRWGLEPESILI